MKRLLPSLLFILGCASVGPVPSAPPASTQAQEEQTFLQETEELIIQGKYEEGLAQLRQFQSQYPQSIYWQDSRLKEADVLDTLGRHKEAAELLRDIYLKTLREQPAIAARALYASSFSHEALGDDLKMLTSLLDAQKLAKELPPEIALAEIPARLASVYGRQGREDEVRKYLHEAEQGLSRVLAQKNPAQQAEWLGRTYVQMGTVSTNQLSKENFSAFVQGQMGVQVYLLRALKLNDLVWSRKAQTRLQEVYRDLNTVFLSTSDNVPLQTRLAGDFYDLMDQAELYRPSAQSGNKYETEFFHYLSQIRQGADRILYEPKETMGLTEESKRLNNLRRPGRVKADAFLPGEVNSTITSPPKVVPSEDPNL